RAEQPEPGVATPDEVDTDDEPDEEVQRAGPAPPGKPVGAQTLDDEERRLGEPADSDTPDREAAAEPRRAQPTGVGKRGLAVRDERRPHEELNHPPPSPRSPTTACACARDH